jgi:Glycosyl hydrolase family 65, C-terminal domain
MAARAGSCARSLAHPGGGGGGLEQRILTAGCSGRLSWTRAGSTQPGHHPVVEDRRHHRPADRIGQQPGLGPALRPLGRDRVRDLVGQVPAAGLADVPALLGMSAEPVPRQFQHLQHIPLGDGLLDPAGQDRDSALGRPAVRAGPGPTGAARRRLAAPHRTAPARIGGLRHYDGTASFTPRLPDGITGLAFSILIRGQLLRVEVTHQSARYLLSDGDPLEIRAPWQAAHAVSGPAGGTADPEARAAATAQPAAAPRARAPQRRRKKPA